MIHDPAGRRLQATRPIFRPAFAYAPLLLLFGSAAAQVPAPAFPPPKWLGPVAAHGKNLQRTMRLLATSTPERRNTVRILFYGQSITEQAWTTLVADDLRTRFPHADLVIENRAIGGHSSQLLVKTAEADLYPFQPDLVIFHVYGAHDRYEDIIRTIRERTTAEVLIQNDHVTRAEAFDEETDPANLPPRGDHWDAFMNHNWLPMLAKKYDAELCDQRAIWKRYLKDHGLEPSALLRDAVHLNAHGEFLMAEAVKSYLRYDPALGASPAEGWVRTYEIGKDADWIAGRLRLPFQGTRVVAIARADAPPTGGPAAVRIDGKSPGDWPGGTVFTRASAYPGMSWPCLLRVQAHAPLVPEDWTLTLAGINDDATRFTFTLRGSVTGDDGAGDSATRFVSPSGRVVIDPDDWNLAYARKVRRGFDPSAGVPPDGFTVTWKAVFTGSDTFFPPVSDAPGVERALTLADGLPAGRYMLEIEGNASVPLAAVRVYRPPLARAQGE